MHISCNQANINIHVKYNICLLWWWSYYIYMIKQFVNDIIACLIYCFRFFQSFDYGYQLFQGCYMVAWKKLSLDQVRHKLLHSCLMVLNMLLLRFPQEVIVRKIIVIKYFCWIKYFILHCRQHYKDKNLHLVIIIYLSLEC